MASQFTPVVRVKTPGQVALDICRTEYPEYHPLISLVRLAHREDVKQNPELEMKIHQSVLPYVAPKLAVKEVEPVQDDDRRIVVSLFEDVEVAPGLVAQAEVPLLLDVDDVLPINSVT